jgi:hypothetical protein
MCFGLDGVALWRQFRAVPADDMALPRGARLFANAFSQPKRRWQWRLNLMIVWSSNGNATLFHIQPFVKAARRVELPVSIRSGSRDFSVWDAIGRSLNTAVCACKGVNHIRGTTQAAIQAARRNDLRIVCLNLSDFGAQAVLLTTGMTAAR